MITDAIHPSLRVSAIAAVGLAALALLAFELDGRWEERKILETDKWEAASVAAKRLAHAKDDSVKHLLTKLDSANRDVARAYARAAAAQARVTIAHDSGVRIDGGEVQPLPAAVVTELRDDRAAMATCASTAALDGVAIRTLREQVSALNDGHAADEHEKASLRRRIPRFGFKSGFVAGVVAAVGAVLKLR